MVGFFEPHIRWRMNATHTRGWTNSCGFSTTLGGRCSVWLGTFLFCFSFVLAAHPLLHAFHISMCTHQAVHCDPILKQRQFSSWHDTYEKFTLYTASAHPFQYGSMSRRMQYRMVWCGSRPPSTGNERDSQRTRSEKSMFYVIVLVCPTFRERFHLVCIVLFSSLIRACVCVWGQRESTRFCSGAEV